MSKISPTYESTPSESVNVQPAHDTAPAEHGDAHPEPQASHTFVATGQSATPDTADEVPVPKERPIRTHARRHSVSGHESADSADSSPTPKTKKGHSSLAYTLDNDPNFIGITTDPVAHWREDVLPDADSSPFTSFTKVPLGPDSEIEDTNRPHAATESAPRAAVRFQDPISSPSSAFTRYADLRNPTYVPPQMPKAPHRASRRSEEFRKHNFYLPDDPGALYAAHKAMSDLHLSSPVPQQPVFTPRPQDFVQPRYSNYESNLNPPGPPSNDSSSETSTTSSSDDTDHVARSSDKKKRSKTRKHHHSQIKLDASPPEKFTGKSRDPKVLKLWDTVGKAYFWSKKTDPDSLIATFIIRDWLSDEPHEWYMRTIWPTLVAQMNTVSRKHAARTASHWSMNRLVAELRSIFGSDTYLADAELRWDALKQTSKNLKSVIAISLQIETAANECHFKTPFDRKKKLLDCLPVEYGRTILDLCEWEDPAVSWDELKAHARTAEKKVQLIRNYDRQFETHIAAPIGNSLLSANSGAINNLLRSTPRVTSSRAKSDTRSSPATSSAPSRDRNSARSRGNDSQRSRGDRPQDRGRERERRGPPKKESLPQEAQRHYEYRLKNNRCLLCGKDHKMRVHDNDGTLQMMVDAGSGDEADSSDTTGSDATHSDVEPLLPTLAPSAPVFSRDDFEVLCRVCAMDPSRFRYLFWTQKEIDHLCHLRSEPEWDGPCVAFTIAEAEEIALKEENSPPPHSLPKLWRARRDVLFNRYLRDPEPINAILDSFHAFDAPRVPAIPRSSRATLDGEGMPPYNGYFTDSDASTDTPVSDPAGPPSSPSAHATVHLEDDSDFDPRQFGNITLPPVVSTPSATSSVPTSKPASRLSAEAEPFHPAPCPDGLSTRAVQDSESLRSATLMHIQPKKQPDIDFSDREALAPPIVFNISLQGQSNFAAMIDCGASDCFLATYIPKLLNLKVHRYIVPKVVKLGTKGSRATINNYCFAEISFAGVQKVQRFDIGNVLTDVIIGLSFLRSHQCIMEFEPDAIYARDLAGIPSSRRGDTKKRARSADSPASPDDLGTFAAMDATVERDPILDMSDEDFARFAKRYALTDEQKGIEPRVLERILVRPVFLLTKAQRQPDYEPSAADKSQFAQWIAEHFADVFVRPQDDLPLPPHREVDHEIPYIDESDPPRPKRTYPIPEKYMSAWSVLHSKHVDAGLWVPATSRNADPMMPVPKAPKDGKIDIRPTSDLRARNLNTRRMTMPPQDPDIIRRQIARHRFHFEGDVKGAFQQIRVKDSDVWKTAFMTIHGVYVTPVAQQGDTNSTVTLARLIMYIFYGLIGTTMEAYADNIFGFADTWKDYCAAVVEILMRCRIHQFHLNAESVKICPTWVNVLGMQAQHGAIRMEEHQRQSILDMKPPVDRKGAQRFIGSVEWLSRFLPHLASFAAPITELCGDVPFVWTKAHDLAFSKIKDLLVQDLHLTAIKESELAPEDPSPIHRDAPPDPSEVITNPVPGKYLFLQTHASNTGVAATVTCGENWWTAKPIGYHSRKLNTHQFNYRTHELELLAVFEGFQKFQTQLLGRKVTVLTDNRALESFFKSARLTPREARLAEFFAQSQIEIKYIKGAYNFVADMLSRQYTRSARDTARNSTWLKDLDDEPHFAALWNSDSDSADSLLADPPAAPRTRRSRQTRLPLRYQDSAAPAAVAVPAAPDTPATSVPPAAAALPVDIASDLPQPAEAPTTVAPTPRRDPPSRTQPSRRSKTQKKSDRVLRLREDEHWELPSESMTELDSSYESDLRTAIRTNYMHDTHFAKVVAAIDGYPAYHLDSEGFLWQNDHLFGERLCIPTGLVRERSIREVILEHIHEMGGHSSASNTTHDARHHFWWSTMARDIATFCSTCPSCQAVNDTHQKPFGKLKQLPVPYAPYDHIAIDFQGPLPLAKWHGEDVNFVCNFVDVFSGELISLPCNMTITAEGCAELFFSHVFPQWGVPRRISSDRDIRFNSELWRFMFQNLGTTLMMSTAYHPQSNPKVERTHRKMNAIFTQFVSEDQKDWPQQLPFVQYSINNLRSASTGFSPFELARIVSPNSLPASLLPRDSTGVSASADATSVSPPASALVDRARLRLQAAQDSIAAARIDQAHYSNLKRRAEPAPAEFYMLKTANMSLVKDRSRKYAPHFVGPFKLLRFDPASSTYTLDLPPRYTSRRIHNTFHASQVKPYVPNDETRFPNRVTNPVPVFPLDEVAQLFSMQPDPAPSILPTTYDSKNASLLISSIISHRIKNMTPDQYPRENRFQQDEDDVIITCRLHDSPHPVDLPLTFPPIQQLIAAERAAPDINPWGKYVSTLVSRKPNDPISWRQLYLFAGPDRHGRNEGALVRATRTFNRNANQMLADKITSSGTDFLGSQAGSVAGSQVDPIESMERWQRDRDMLPPARSSTPRETGRRHQPYPPPRHQRSRSPPRHRSSNDSRRSDRSSSHSSHQSSQSGYQQSGYTSSTSAPSQPAPQPSYDSNGYSPVPVFTDSQGHQLTPRTPSPGHHRRAAARRDERDAQLAIEEQHRQQQAQQQQLAQQAQQAQLAEEQAQRAQQAQVEQQARLAQQAQFAQQVFQVQPAPPLASAPVVLPVATSQPSDITHDGLAAGLHHQATGPVPVVAPQPAVVAAPQPDVHMDAPDSQAPSSAQDDLIDWEPSTLIPNMGFPYASNPATDEERVNRRLLSGFRAFDDFADPAQARHWGFAPDEEYNDTLEVIL